MIALACPYCGTTDLAAAGHVAADFKCEQCGKLIQLYNVKWILVPMTLKITVKDEEAKST